MSPVQDEEELTRKQRREQARAERKALEQSEAASAKRRTRLAQLGVVAAVVVAAIVVILIATGGGKSGPPKTGKEKSKVASEVTALVGGIHQNGNALGSPTAPVTLQYFGDLECPICREFTLGALPAVIERWVRSGKLRIEYRSMETATREPETFKNQQVAALAAGEQAKMWDFVELFYHEQGEEDSGYVTESYLDNLAQQVPGLDLAKWHSDRGEPALANKVAEDEQAANNAGFTGTPSFLIGRSGGELKKLENPNLETSSDFDSAIESLLKS